MIDVGVNFTGLEDLINAFELDIGPKLVRGGGFNLATEIRRATFFAMEQVLRFLVGRAQANAPIDTGALRRSIVGYIGGIPVAGSPGTLRTVRSYSSAELRTNVNATIRANAAYAFYVHEFFTWPEEETRFEVDVAPELRGGRGRHMISGIAERVAQTRDSRGRLRDLSNANLKKPRLFALTPEGGVGGKYLGRALERNIPRISQIMKDAMRKAFEQSLVSRRSGIVKETSRLRERAQQVLGAGVEPVFNEDVTGIGFGGAAGLQFALTGFGLGGGQFGPFTGGFTDLPILLGREFLGGEDE